MKITLLQVVKNLFMVALLGAFNLPGWAQTFNFQTWNTGNNSILTVDAFRSVTIDKRGTVWVGSDLGGLYSFKDSTWTKGNTYPDVTFRHLVPSNMVADSNVWATSIGKNAVQAITGGAYHIETKSETVTQYGSGIFGGLGSRYANSLAMSSRGLTYVALAQSTTGGNVNQGGVYSTSTVNPPPASATSFTKAIQDEGDILYYSAGNRGDELWFGRGGNCDGGCKAAYIARISSGGETLPPITASNSPLPFTNSSGSPFARAIFTDTTTGNTFVGLNSGGIGICRPDWSWKLLNDANSPLPAFTAVNFNAIADVYGEIWIGTTAGIFVYNGTGSLDSMNSFKMLTPADGIPAGSITDIAVDTAMSHIWVTSSGGVSRAPYVPQYIKGIVYNVFCNQAGSSLDSLKLNEVLQKKPMISGVKVKLLENGEVKDSSETNTDGVFELKEAEDGKIYTVEISYKKEDKEIKYEYSNIKNHTLMGAILIPDSLIGEIKAFKPKMVERCFKLKLQFLAELTLACREGFDVTDYDQAYEQFYDINGIKTDHKKRVENLADFYTSLATVYNLGGHSTDLANEAIASGFDAAESLFSFVKLGSVVKAKGVWENAADLALASSKLLKEGLISILNLANTTFVTSPDGQRIIGNIITCVNDMGDISITLLEKGKEAGDDFAMELIKKTMALELASFYYYYYCHEQHKKFISNAAGSSKIAYSNYPYDQTFNRLYSPAANSLAKQAKDTVDDRKGKIENYNTTAKYAGLAADVLDASIALSLIPGGQLAAAIAKGLAVAAKGVKAYALTSAMVEGVSGCLQVTALSGKILPEAGFTNNKPIKSSYSRIKNPPSQLSPASLLIRKNSYNQKLTELKAIYNTPLYDSVAYFAKYDELANEDSLYTDEMTKTLNALWASTDSAVILVPGFKDKLGKVIDSFVSQQYTVRHSFYYQNLAYIFDNDKAGYVAELNNLADEIIWRNDSAVNGIGYLVDDINFNGIAAPAYLVQDGYSLNHTHQPGSSGSFTYTFKNYGTEPQNNVSFKISQPTSGYIFTSADSIYAGTIQAGESRQISFSFTAPLTDSICRYAIDVKAANGSFRDVTGSLYVIDPTKTYSVKDGNWSDANTWSSKTVPTNTSNVVISHLVTIDVDANCNSIKALAPGEIQVNTGRHLNVLQ